MQYLLQECSHFVAISFVENIIHSFSSDVLRFSAAFFSVFLVLDPASFFVLEARLIRRFRPRNSIASFGDNDDDDDDNDDDDDGDGVDVDVGVGMIFSSLSKNNVNNLTRSANRASVKGQPTETNDLP